MSHKLENALLRSRAAHEELVLALMELSFRVDELACAIEEMKNSSSTLACWDLQLAWLVIGAIETRLCIEPVDLSVKTITETVQRRHDMTVEARRVGYVIRDVIGLKTERRGGRWGGRYYVMYDADVVEAWRAKHECDG